MSVARADCEAATTRIGSAEHRRLLADFFIGTHREYTADDIDWPTLSESELARLTGLPFWQEAVATEAVTSATVTAAAARSCPGGNARPSGCAAPGSFSSSSPRG